MSGGWRSAGYYELHRAEPGILIEILLPKKSRFQGGLHESLRKGADMNNVRRHFRTTNRRKRLRIKKLLHFYTVLSKYRNQDIDKLDRVFEGYSMYEVDGVFYSSKKRTTNKPKEYEERTQIIKLMFLPKYVSGTSPRAQNKRKKQLAIARAFLPLFSQSHPKDETFSPTNYEDVLTDEIRKSIGSSLGHREGEDLLGHEKKYILYLIRWVHSVALWVFGYVVYQVLDTIHGLKKDYPPEEEIWVTSQFDFVVNKLKLY